MNPDVKQTWLTALRSGNYVQGRERLVDLGTDGSKKYCCLGVLCDLAVKAGVNVEVLESQYDHVVTYDHEISILPNSVMEWAGLDDCNPNVYRHTIPDSDGRIVMFSLAELNDGCESFRVPARSFAEIADIIEREL